MKRFRIIIPTRKRHAKLHRTLASIPGLPYLELVIFFDGDDEGRDRFGTVDSAYPFPITLLSSPTRIGAVKARNYVLGGATDGVLCATDDIEFMPGSIEAAFAAFNDMFPDDDGVVGFVQEGVPNFHPTGVVLVGKTFLQRYPGQRMYFDGYDHFACQEIHWLALKLGGKFTQVLDARLFHYHPSFHHEEDDETHVLARAHSARDHTLINRRAREGKVWGA